MRRRSSQSGFTLIEILVASMLMAMLITILTMVFNSSSIAWSTGRATVTKMNKMRRGMAAATIEADNAIPGWKVGGSLSDWGYLVGPWDAQGKLRSRAIWNLPEVGQVLLANPTFGSGKGSWVYEGNETLWATFNPDDIQKADKEQAYGVGVWSLGPDGKENSGDDISTWPDE